MSSLSNDRAGQYHNDMLGMASDTVLRMTTLPRLMLTMLESDGWRKLERPIDHQVFHNETIADWVLGKPWPGLNFPNWAMVYAILEKNIEVGDQCIAKLKNVGAPSPDAAEREFITAVGRQKGKPPTHHEAGAKGGRGNKAADDVRGFVHGNSAEYLSRRLLRDAPEIFEALERGEFKSVRSAAKAAGLVKERTKFEQAQRLWTKLTLDERHAFLRWAQTTSSAGDAG